MAGLVERHVSHIYGILNCWDRLLLTGTLVDICYPEAMEAQLRKRQMRLFDYTKFVEPQRDLIRANAEQIAEQSGLKIEFVRSANVRKESLVEKVLETRGKHVGVVAILSAMEGCKCYEPWHDKKTGRTFLRMREGKCLHYYFYMIAEGIGLCHVRVPTWAPYRLQVCLNGHNVLAERLKQRGIGFKMADNCFIDIEDFELAQQLADQFDVRELHELLDEMARLFCPVEEWYERGYHWSIEQAEYSTDIVFDSPASLAPLYDELVRTSVHAVKAEQVAMFLGKKLDARYLGELGSDYHTRIEGRRIKHHMGKNSIKMYDKVGRVLRIETTTNDVTFFQHHRRVEHKDGTSEVKMAPVRKTIYSLGALGELMGAANWRYLEYLSALEDPSEGARALDKVSAPAREKERSWKGFNLFSVEDLKIFETCMRGEINLAGLSNRMFQTALGKTSSQVSRLLKRLRTHGLIRKIRWTHRYHLTDLGRKVIAAALKIRKFIVIPTLAGTSASSAK